MQELALAKAERERLDEREQAIRKVERELAGLRMHLQEERARLTGSAPSEPPEPARDPEPEGEPPPPTPLPQPPTDPDLEPAAQGSPPQSMLATAAQETALEQPPASLLSSAIARREAGGLLRRAFLHVCVCELSRPT